MDEVREYMLQFESQLEAFQDALKESMSEVHKHHEIVSPLWQDTMRRDYDVTWVPLEEAMDLYIQRVGPEQVEIMLTKLRHLGRYLYGH